MARPVRRGVGAQLVAVARRLDARTADLRFGAPVSHVYRPLHYARASAEAYLLRFARAGIEALFLGMNPGPFGMAQTGVPFGEVAAVRDWLGIEAVVARPVPEHPKRRVQGFACPRSEVSGARLWGFARERFGTPADFFERFFVWNYCPLAFLEASGRNRTPDHLPASERVPLFEACDDALRETVRLLRPTWVLGVGAFAETRARAVLGDRGPRLGTILHPSPASPAANRGWAAQACAQLNALGLQVPIGPGPSRPARRRKQTFDDACG